MAIRHILLALSTAAPCEAAVDAAARLARDDGAEVEALCLFPEPPTGVADSFAVGRQGVAEVLEHRQASVRELTDPVEALYRERLAGPGLGAGWSVGETRLAAPQALERARLADLVVLSHGSRDAGFRALTEALVLSSGAPCLLVPDAGRRHPRFERVVVAWNGSREARRATFDALPLLERAKVVAVALVGGEPLRQADQSDALVRQLARHGVAAERLYEEAQGRGAGDALLDRCAAFGADLLVMGAYGHSRAAELVLGGATRTVLAHTRLPTLLSH